MKFLLTILFILSASILLTAQETKLGKEISLKEKVLISNILTSPEKYVGKKVLVEGTIVDVCENRGCWIEVAGDKPFTKIKVKVKDGEIVFPVSAKGKKVTVEGEVYALTMSKSEMIEQMMHESEENGIKADTTHASDSTWYQIKGIGASIK